MLDQTKLENSLNIYFKNAELLKMAFTHSSYVNEASTEKIESNERLEFLGDSILEMAATIFLYKKFPALPEGELTALRSALVRGNNLALVSEELGLGEHLFLSKGEEVSGGRTKKYILANVAESLIGAIFLDQGYEVAEKFIDTHILSKVGQVFELGLHIDSKSKFQEKAQELENTTPDYRLISETGPDHDKVFQMGVFLNDILVATGEGSSKQKAEQEAAREGIVVKRW